MVAIFVFVTVRMRKRGNMQLKKYVIVCLPNREERIEKKKRIMVCENPFFFQV